MDSTSETFASTEDRLLSTMDQAASRFVAMLGEDATDAAGNPIDLPTQMKVFDMAQKWLKERKRLRPDDGGESAAVTEMREWINNPASREAFRGLMHEVGVVVIPDKVPGRPSKSQQPIRDRYKLHKEGKKLSKQDEEGAALAKELGLDL